MRAPHPRFAASTRPGGFTAAAAAVCLLACAAPLTAHSAARSLADVASASGAAARNADAAVATSAGAAKPTEAARSPEASGGAGSGAPADAGKHAGDVGSFSGTLLTGVDIESGPSAIRVSLRGSGRLEPVGAGDAGGPPARVFVDLLTASALTPVRGGLGPVRGVRAVDGTPGVTRVVIDLDRPRAYHLERGRDRIEDLVIVFDAVTPAQPVAGPPPVPGASAAATTRATSVSGPPQRWLTVRGLRASLGASYEKNDLAVSDQQSIRSIDRTTSPLASVRATFAVADPGILLVDASADVRLTLSRYTSSPYRRTSNDSIRNYRVNAILLSGRGSPLTVYAQRYDSFLDQRQTSLASDPLSLSQTGRQTTRGFSWDLNKGGLPHVSLAGVFSRRDDAGSRLNGADSIAHERRFEARADKSFPRWQYEGSYVYDDYRYRFPLLQLNTETGYQFLRAGATWTPVVGLRMTLGARYATFRMQRAERGETARGFGGAGTEAGISWDAGSHVQVQASHNGSLNENELSLTAATTKADTTPAGRRRFYLQEFTGRVALTTASRKSSVAAFVRGTWLDPLSIGPATLDTLTVGGIDVSHGQTIAGFDLSLGAQAGAGTVTSSRGDRGHYRDADAHIRVGRQLARASFAVTGGARQTDSPWFHPVGGRAWYGNVDLTGVVARELQLRASAGRSFLLNDVFVQRGDNHADTLSGSISGSRYEAGVDYSTIDATTRGLLVPLVGLDVRPDLLRLERPDLFGVLWGSRQRVREAHVRVVPTRGLEIFARAGATRQDMPGFVGQNVFDQRLGQAGAIWGLRQLQLEVGWQYLEYSSLAASSVDRRVYVRVRRDVPIF